MRKILNIKTLHDIKRYLKCHISVEHALHKIFMFYDLSYF